MIFTQLSLTDFGLFRGAHIIPLTPKPGRPVILFGGKNGAGKTTLFEAFKLCLYGKTLPEFNNVENYAKYIKSKIHKSSKLIFQPATSIISIEFEYVRAGQIDIFHIERRWHIKDQGVDEEFDVKINGSKLEDISASHWQDFVTELLPIGISKLFFFDGEQIQFLANDDTDEIHLKDSFYSLLGLDLIKRLSSDLQIILTRNFKKSDKSWTDKLKGLYAEHINIEEEIEKLNQNRGDIENKKNNRQKKVIELQSKLSSEGGYFAKEQDKLIARKTQLDWELQQKYDILRDLCAGALPFAFIPEYCKLLQNRLVQEKTDHLNILVSNQIINDIQNLRDRTISKITENNEIPKQQAKQLVADVKKIFDEEIKKNNLKRNHDDEQLIHIKHLSISDQDRILNWIDDALEDIPIKVKKITYDIDTLTTELQKTEGQLSKVPSDEVIGPIVSQLNEINKEIGYLEGLLKDTDEKLTQVKHKYRLSSNHIKDAEYDKKNYEKLNRGLNLAVKVQDILKEYENRLKNERISELELQIIKRMNILMHKKLFTKITINPETFQVMLYASDKPIPKEELSAGEKQIYAIAVLWALAQNSGKNLPFIIDTPLARLDSEHRLNLVQNFFPIASRQVLIFSTDTEIDKKYFKELSPHIAISYHLEYDQENKCTKVKENEFFWAPEILENENLIQKKKEYGEK